MNVLVIGGGGREHAICWKLRQSPRVDKLYCAPGNGGIASVATCVDVGARDIEGIIRFVKANGIDLTFVAPDDPLADGMVDALEAAGCAAFGPVKAAAQIEASKAFGKYIMEKYGIPTAKSVSFTDAEQAKAYIAKEGAPIVVKADGLALGKGVFVCMTVAEAQSAVESILVQGAFGEAGNSIIVEEYMQGPEVSLLCFTDGKSVSVMPPAQDHKRVFDGDKGPNTGGMGAFAPTPKFSAEQTDWAIQHVLLPAIRGLANEGCPFKGVLYAGLMLTPDGIRVLEFNARFGDPETQVILPLLKTDLLDIMEAIRNERLAELDIQWSRGAAAVVVLASGGYPGVYPKGYPITGLDKAGALADITVFHSGTKLAGGDVVTNGGRVLGVTAVSDRLAAAINLAYEGVDAIHFRDCQFRRDIGRK
jgi:phosphoribosylamine---glycine ligase